MAQHRKGLSRVFVCGCKRVVKTLNDELLFDFFLSSSDLIPHSHATSRATILSYDPLSFALRLSSDDEAVPGGSVPRASTCDDALDMRTLRYMDRARALPSR